MTPTDKDRERAREVYARIKLPISPGTELEHMRRDPNYCAHAVEQIATALQMERERAAVRAIANFSPHPRGEARAREIVAYVRDGGKLILDEDEIAAAILRGDE